MRKLGSGGQSHVYQAAQLSDGSNVAIKVLLPEHVSQRVTPTSGTANKFGSYAHRFTREGQLMSVLHHWNIAECFETGETEVEGQMVPYTVMEYVPGKTLDQELRAKCQARGRLVSYTNDEGELRWRYQSPEETNQRLRAPMFSLAEALEIIRQLLAALSYLHDLSGTRGGVALGSIHHRDVKPQNILLVRTSSLIFRRLVLLDLGIAKITQDLAELLGVQHTLTATGALVGTPFFMAPEQMKDASSVGAPTDVYTSGLMFFMMLTGLLPHGEQPNLGAYLYALGNAQPYDPRQFVDGIPDEIAAIIMRAMANNPKERFQNAFEMLTALNVAISNLVARATGLHSDHSGAPTGEYGSNVSVPQFPHARLPAPPPVLASAVTPPPVPAMATMQPVTPAKSGIGIYVAAAALAGIIGVASVVAYRFGGTREEKAESISAPAAPTTQVVETRPIEHLPKAPAMVRPTKKAEDPPKDLAPGTVRELCNAYRIQLRIDRGAAEKTLRDAKGYPAFYTEEACRNLRGL